MSMDNEACDASTEFAAGLTSALNMAIIAISNI